MATATPACAREVRGTCLRVSGQNVLNPIGRRASQGFVETLLQEMRKVLKLIRSETGARFAALRRMSLSQKWPYFVPKPIPQNGDGADEVGTGLGTPRFRTMFDQAEEKQIRIRLAETLRWIVSQRLLPKVGGGRIAALEIMGNTLRVKEAIEHGESEGKTFYDIIESAAAFGWKTFDIAVLELFEQGLITEETALLYCTNKGVVSRGIDKIKKTRGESTTNLTGLALDIKYGKK